MLFRLENIFIYTPLNPFQCQRYQLIRFSQLFTFCQLICHIQWDTNFNGGEGKRVWNEWIINIIEIIQCTKRWMILFCCCWIIALRSIVNFVIYSFFASQFHFVSFSRKWPEKKKLFYQKKSWKWNDDDDGAKQLIVGNQTIMRKTTSAMRFYFIFSLIILIFFLKIFIFFPIDLKLKKWN